jgi:adenosylcobinamide-GDP ribazoletransferase
MNGLFAAIRSLTVFNRPGRKERDLADALPWFPIVGAGIGLFVWMVMALAMACSRQWAMGSAAVALCFSAWLTRGATLAGLGQATDAVGSGIAAWREVQIIKDPHLRASGVVAIVAALMIKWMALIRLSEIKSLVMVVVACALSRAAMVELAGSLRYAREETGASRAMVEGADSRHSLSAMVVALVMCLLVAGPIGAAAFVLGWGFSILFAAYLSRVIGGVTEELLGACCELTEILVLLVSTAVVAYFPPQASWKFLGW